MNCTELLSDIDQLKTHLAQLEDAFDSANETGENTPTLQATNHEASTATDTLLEKYLDDFIKQNPEIASDTLNLGDRIEIKDANGKPLRRIHNVTPLSNNRILIGEWYARLFSTNINQDDTLELDERVMVRDVGGNPAFIKAITPVSNGHVLIGGSNGALYNATIDEGGLLNLGRHPIQIREASGFPASIETITPVSNHRALINGDGEALYLATIDEYGRLDLGNRISFRDAFGRLLENRSELREKNVVVPLSNGHLLMGVNGALYNGTIKKNRQNIQLYLDDPIQTKTNEISNITPLPNGHILIGGSDGILCDATINKYGHINFGDYTEIKDAHGEPATIHAITPISDHLVLIGGSNGALYGAKFSQDGQFSIGNRIVFQGADGEPAHVDTITPLPNGHILITGSHDAVYNASFGTPNLDHLKHHLKDIARKTTRKAS